MTFLFCQKAPQNHIQSLNIVQFRAHQMGTSIKTLGVFFSYEIKEAIRLNFESILEALETKFMETEIFNYFREISTNR